MKNKTNHLFILLIPIFFLSCSNLLQNSKGTLKIIVPGNSSTNSSARYVEFKDRDYKFVITITDRKNYNHTVNATSGQELSLSLDEGIYYINATAYFNDNSDYSDVVYKCKDESIVTIKADTTTSLNLEMYRQYFPTETFEKNVWGDQTKDEYNYYLGAPFTDADNLKNFTTVFEPKNKLSVTLYGIPDKDFEADVYAKVSDISNNSWKQIGSSLPIHIKATAGKKIVQNFDIIITEKATSAAKTELSFGYENDSFNKTVTLKDFAFEVNLTPSFNVLTYTYVVGGNKYEVYYPDNSDITLPSSQYDIFGYPFCEQDFLGWYENPEYKGNSISKISAKDNVSNKTFYAKWNLNIRKSEWSDDSGNTQYNYAIDTRINDVLPDFNKILSAGDNLIIKLEGKTSKDFTGNLFCQLINDFENWHAVAFSNYYVDTKANEKITAYFLFEVPEDAKFTSLYTTGLQFGYEKSTFDAPMIISDFKVSEITAIPSASTEHMILNSSSKGVEITVKRSENDRPWLNDTIISDAFSNTSFRIPQNVFEKNDEITFTWPLCKSGETYLFVLYYYLNENNTPCTEQIYCTANGGLGELNYDNYNKMSVELLSENDGRYVQINGFNDSSRDTLFNKINVEKLQFNISFFSGNSDWSDSKWIYSFNHNCEEPCENNSFYKQLVDYEKFNFLAEYAESYKTPYEINEELSQKSTYFALANYSFSIPGYESSGFFYTSDIISQTEKYSPYSFTEKGNITIHIEIPTSEKPDIFMNIEKIEMTTEDPVLDNTFTLKANIASKDETLDLSTAQIKYYWSFNGIPLKDSIDSSSTSSTIIIDCSNIPPNEYEAKCVAIITANGKDIILEQDFKINIIKNIYQPLQEELR